MKSSRLYLGFALGFLVFAQSITLIPAIAYGTQFGIEVEYASETSIQPNESEIDSEMYLKPLEIVRHCMGDTQGVISLKKWEKRPNKNIRAGVYTDPKGREWQVAPESVNTVGYDGFEFITPPIETPEDKALLVKVLRKIAKTGKYGKGIRSSIHVTVDVSHLFSVDGDASKLVDTILYIESHWPEIYAAVSPTRYGTIVNRFSIPLAAQHHDLLKEMSDLEPRARTYQNLKALFERYHEKELAAKNGMKLFAWKYRSANYRKLFQLGLKSMIPVIEFRILDFQKDPQDILRLADLFLKIIDTSHSIQSKRSFENPLLQFNQDFDRKELNEVIYKGDPKRYEEFLADLGLDPLRYPRFKTLHTPPTVELPTEALKKAYEVFNPKLPIRYQGKPITFGFEVEMWGPSVKRVVPNLSESKVSVDRFPFLDGSVDKELTGNIEVRSKPSDVLATTISQMKKIASVLDGGVAGFHLHMRVPMELARTIPPDQLQGWLSRISDAIYAWRLEYRPHKFALRGGTQLRRPPHHLEKKGTITVKTIENTLDIELRGFMNDIEKYDQYAKILIAGFHNPHLVQGASDFQSVLHVQAKTLQEEISDFIRKYEQRPLTQEEIYLIEDLNEFATKNGILPLFGFEHSPYFTQLDAIRIQDANFEFKYKTLKLLYDVTIKKKFERQSEEFYAEFRWIIKDWGKSIHIYRLLERTLLLFPMEITRPLHDPIFLRKLILASGSPEVDLITSQAAKRLLYRLPKDTYFQVLKASLYGTHPILKRNALNILTELAIDKTYSEMDRRIQAADLVQKVIQEALKERSSLPMH